MPPLIAESRGSASHEQPRDSDIDRYLSLGGNSKENLDRLIAEAKQQFRERGKQ